MYYNLQNIKQIYGSEVCSDVRLLPMLLKSGFYKL